MTDRLTPEEIRDIAERTMMSGSLEAHGFFGGLTTEGHAARVLFRQGRRYDDLVLFTKDGDDDFGIGAPPGGEFSVLARYTFPIVSELGPVVVSDRVISVNADDATAWIQAVTSSIRPSGRLEDFKREPMEDERFWQLVGLLDGQIDDEGLEALIGALSELTPGDLDSFNDTLAIKLHALDHPGNTMRWSGMVSADASLYYRCEIVAAGRAEFESHLREPRSSDDPEAGAVGEALLGIVDSVAVHELSEPPVPIETGTNPEHWPDAPAPVVEPLSTEPSPGPFSYETQLYRLRITSTYVGSLTSFVAFATTATGQVREIMGCLMATSIVAGRAEAEAFVRELLRDGEQLVPEIVVYQPGVDGVTRGVDMVGIERRSTLGMQDYIDTYYRGVLPPPELRKRR